MLCFGVDVIVGEEERIDLSEGRVLCLCLSYVKDNKNRRKRCARMREDIENWGKWESRRIEYPIMS